MRARITTVALLWILTQVPRLLAAALPAREPAPAEPGSILIVGESAQDQRGQRPSMVYLWNGRKRDTLVLQAPRQAQRVGVAKCMAINRDGQEYLLNGNRNTIVRVDKGGETTVFTHATYVRDVALDNADDIYFSEASGAGNGGKIYRLRADKGKPATAELVCTVPLANVRFWAGDFAFGRQAGGTVDPDTIYLSSGNLVGASVYRMTRQADGWTRPQQVFQAKTTIGGLLLASPREAYYVTGNRVFRLTDLQNPEVVLTLPAGSHLTDLLLLPSGRKAKR
jgi:hypothetical protein